MEGNVTSTVRKALEKKKGELAHKMIKMTKLPVKDNNTRNLPVKDENKKK